MADEQVELENSVLGKLKLTGPTTVLLLLLAAAAGAAFAVYKVEEHESAAKVRETSLATAIEKLATSQDALVVAQREQTCAFAFRREGQTPENLLNFCKQFSR